jgi:hypothetical protein
MTSDVLIPAGYGWSDCFTLGVFSASLSVEGKQRALGAIRVQ